MDKKESAEAARMVLLADLESPDEEVRTRALGSLCPCRSEWELFEQHVKSISRLKKNGSREIRLQALHMLSDAARLQSLADAEYRFQSVEDALRKKRALRSRGGEADSQVRRSGQFKRRKGSFVLR